MNTVMTKKTLMNLPPRQSVLIESDHGLGKSSVVAQVAAAISKVLGKPFGLIDFRLAQCEVADLIGMMYNSPKATLKRIVYIDGKVSEISETVENVTVHSLADWFPTDPDSYGFLFLDELFRAPRDLQNAVLELALDYKYHFKELPMGWNVISAANDKMDRYAGIVPDPALYDRFFKIKFDPSTEEWMEYAKSVQAHQSIISYIEKVPDDLEIPEKYEPGTIVPSRRAWVQFGNHLNHLTETGQKPLEDLEYLLLLAKGYIGDVAVSYVDFVKNNFKLYTPEQILLTPVSGMLEDIKEKDPTERAYYEKIILKYIGEYPLNNKSLGNLFKYFKMLPKEEATGFWTNFLSENRTEATKFHSSSQEIKNYIWSLLNKHEALK